MVGAPTASAVFDFENILPQLDFLPIAARRALDHAGLRLSLEAWRSLGLEDRCQLVAAGADDIVDSTSVAGVVRRASPPAQRIEVVGDPDPLAPPDGLLRLLEPVPLDARQWARLRALDRYALAHVHRRSIARNDPSLIQAAYEDIVMGHLRSLRPPPGEAGGRGMGSTTPPPDLPPPPPLPRGGRLDAPAVPSFAGELHARGHDEPASSRPSQEVFGTRTTQRKMDTTPVREAASRSQNRPHGTAPSFRRPQVAEIAGPPQDPPQRLYETPIAGRVEIGGRTPEAPGVRGYGSGSRGFDTPSARRATPMPPQVADTSPHIEISHGDELIPEGEHDLLAHLDEQIDVPPPVIPELTPPRMEIHSAHLAEGADARLLSSHLTESGDARMVDVGEKDITARRAVASSTVRMRRETFRRLAQNDTPKGDVLAAARIAGIMAAKRTSELIPLCHGIHVTSVEVQIDLDGATSSVHIFATAEAVDRTGVEMEAMVAASIAGLTIYDMLKGIDRDMSITDVKLLEKSGGRTGHYVRRDA